MSLPLSDEAAAFDRVARYLRHAKAAHVHRIEQPYRGEVLSRLTWEDATLAVFARADTLKSLAAKAAR